MRNVKIEDVKVGQKFGYKNQVFIKCPMVCYPACNPVDEVGFSLNECVMYLIKENTDVNVHYWEEMSYPKNFELMEAWKNGAPIQEKEKDSETWGDRGYDTEPPIWDWYHCDYRIKPSTHDI